MFIGCVSCDGKCAKDGGFPPSACANNGWAEKEDILVIPDDVIIQKYISNPITSAVVFGLLEPFEQFSEIVTFIDKMRNKHHCDDTVVIYTGYDETEISSQIEQLKAFKNIIVKFGRYKRGQQPHYDEVLGVKLASDNQYAKQIS